MREYTFEALKNLDWVFCASFWSSFFYIDIGERNGFRLKLYEVDGFWRKIYRLSMVGNGFLNIQHKEGKKLYNYLWRKEQTKLVEKQRKLTDRQQQEFNRYMGLIDQEIKRSKDNG